MLPSDSRRLWTTLGPIVVLLSSYGCRDNPPARTASEPTTNAVDGANGEDESASEPIATQPPQSITNSLDMRLVRIPAGSFFMGSAASDPGARGDEMPRHEVQISKPFYLGVHEVTQTQYLEIMGTNPSSFQRSGLLKDAPADIDADRLPVDNVTWYSAVDFCRRLSRRPEESRAGRVYRLPTEAEWEYACRAGTETPFHYGAALSSSQANFNGKHPFGSAPIDGFLNRTAPVGSFKPNKFGLYDMHGNLHEWCLDRFRRDYYSVSPEQDPQGPKYGTSRVIRGGDWYSDGRDCRSAFRYADIPDGRFYALGMRVVCELSAEGAAIHPIIATVKQPEANTRDKTGQTPLTEKPDPTVGEDWPRWRGRRGDGTWRAPNLPETWPANGLQRVWRREVGGGYGGVTVTGGRVYLMDRQRTPQDSERVLCFDAVSGQPLWSHTYEVDYQNVAYDNGPRSTPTVFQGRVYTLGAVGHLNCLDAATGEVIWTQDLVGDFAARIPIWGLSASPLVFQDLLIVHSGSEPDGCFLAFERGDGKERWRSLPDAAGYATPILIEHGGRQQLVGWTPQNVCGLDPHSGNLQWQVPFAVNYGTSIANPIFHEGLILVSSYYDGSQAIRIAEDSQAAEVVWHDRRNLRGLMSQPLYRNGHSYLIDKRHGLTCFVMATGQKLWDDDNRLTPKGRNPQATMVWINDQGRAIVLNSDGDLVLIHLDPSGYTEQARAKIIGRTWAHPAYAGNCVFARDDKELVCVLLPSAN
ncbi:MAG: SUMF1/EgtB/PvdO family nonheme iron enzyme [Planctomycetaceae bacterium]